MLPEIDARYAAYGSFVWAEFMSEVGNVSQLNQNAVFSCTKYQLLAQINMILSVLMSRNQTEVEAMMTLVPSAYRSLLYKLLVKDVVR